MTMYGMTTYTIKDVCGMLADYIREGGHRKAGYWLGEESAERMKLPRPGHYDRRTAAKALIEGCDVTLDLGYSGQLLDTHDRVRLAGVGELRDRLRWYR
jgi:riboflavin synthase